MQTLHNLPGITDKKKRRLGQGHGSGRVKTSGRGTKGQKARGKTPLRFEGGALPLIKRLPFIRGKGKNKSFRAKPVIIESGELSVFKKNEVVDGTTLVAHKLVSQKEVDTRGVKIVGAGELTQPLTVKVRVTAAAQKAIEKAGGSIEKTS